MFKLTAVTAEAPHTLHLVFSDGAEVNADLSGLLARGGVFAPLREAAFFEEVQLGPRGRTVMWPGELDLDADVFRPETFQGEPPEFPLEYTPPPAENPVSVMLRRAVETSRESQSTIAQRAGMHQQSLSRLIDPYYSGHSLSSLQRLADALDLELHVELRAKTGKRAS